MIQYWKETSKAVASGAGQTISEDHQAKIFYDSATNTWGYRGSVAFSDDSKSISYRRAVFVDESDHTMVSVSYRQDDSTVNGKERQPMTSDEFWEMFGTLMSLEQHMQAVIDKKAKQLAGTGATGSMGSGTATSASSK